MKLIIIALFLTLVTASRSISQIERLYISGPATPVFTAGQDGYTCFRIPAIIQLKNRELLAFAEGRKNGCSDTGDIDLVMKRSSDQGNTWSNLKVIWNDEENTCGNPAPVVNEINGYIFLLSTWNLGSDREPQIIDQRSTDTRRVFLLRSKDQGKSWTKPKEITKDVKAPNWTWYATGPGSGIQLTTGPNVGRMIIGCDHIEAGTMKYYSHAIYSDNGGRNWKLGGSSMKDQVNECEVAELSNGQLIMNMRNYDRSQKTRQIMKSDDGGLSWSGQRHDKTLIEPICQASLLSTGQFLLFSNPASEEKEKK
ncbi:MAG: exo-alpha-sialidase [Saprospiraceae bacterium]|nr:exo-alpha-sialidase [Saprospiraceae bacterium]